MYMINKDIDKITEQDLQELIKNETIEKKTLEYKSELPGYTDSDKKEFLADVSSFANASGGDIIYGMTSDNNTGKPLAVEGIAVNNVDDEIRRLDQMIQSGIEPRISYEPIHHIKLDDSKYILIIRIPRSWRKPHRISFKEDHKFWSRSTSNKYRLDVGELRTMFNLSDTLAERIRRFREDRISSIIANETFIPLGENPKIVLHLIPLISFELGQRYDISIVDKEHRKISLGSGHERYNLDGYLTYFYDYNDPVSGFYVQLFRNGTIEDTNGYMIPRRENKEIISSTYIERQIIDSLKRYIAIMKELLIELPILFFLSLLGVDGYTIDFQDIPNGFISCIDMNRRPIDRDNLLLPEVTIENYDEPAYKILKPCFDSLWNACGLARDPHYDENGDWKR
jgi:hypothetical protein